MSQENKDSRPNPRFRWIHRDIDLSDHECPSISQDLPLLPERVFLKLAQHWNQKYSAQANKKHCIAEVHEFALAAVLVAREYGKTFSNIAWQQIQENIDLTPQLSEIRLTWLIAGCAKEDPPGVHNNSPIKTLQQNLAHQGYLTHIVLLKLAWLVRPWLNCEETLPVLLISVAESAYPSFLMAWGLAAAITSPKELQEKAESFRGIDQDMTKSFDSHLEKIQSFHGVGLMEAFWETESKCRRLIAEAAFC